MKRINITIAAFSLLTITTILVSGVSAAGHFDIMATGNGRVILPGGEKIIDNSGTVAVGIALDYFHGPAGRIINAVVLEFDQGTGNEVRFIWEIWKTLELTIKGETVTVYLTKPPVVPGGSNHDKKGDLLGPIVVTLSGNQITLVGAHNVYFEGTIIAA